MTCVSELKQLKNLQQLKILILLMTSVSELQQLKIFQFYLFVRDSSPPVNFEYRTHTFADQGGKIDPAMHVNKTLTHVDQSEVRTRKS